MKKLALIAAAAVAWSGAALADGPDWTYIDVSYLRGDSGDEESDGFSIKGSVEFADKYVLGLAYYDGEVGIFDFDSDVSDNVDFDGYTVEFGVRPALSDTIDLVVDLGYFDLEQDGDIAGFGNDNGVDGYLTNVGVRAQILDNVDVWAIATGYFGEADCDSSFASDEFCVAFGQVAQDGDDFTEMAAQIGGQYQWTERAGVTINHTIDGLFGEDLTQFGIRYTFQ